MSDDVTIIILGASGDLTSRLLFPVLHRLMALDRLATSTASRRHTSSSTAHCCSIWRCSGNRLGTTVRPGPRCRRRCEPGGARIR